MEMHPGAIARGFLIRVFVTQLEIPIARDTATTRARSLRPSTLTSSRRWRFAPVARYNVTRGAHKLALPSTNLHTRVPFLPVSRLHLATARRASSAKTVTFTRSCSQFYRSRPAICNRVSLRFARRRQKVVGDDERGSRWRAFLITANLAVVKTLICIGGNDEASANWPLSREERFRALIGRANGTRRESAGGEKLIATINFVNYNSLLIIITLPQTIERIEQAPSRRDEPLVVDKSAWIDSLRWTDKG